MSEREDIIYGYVKKRNPFYSDDRKWRITDIIDVMDYTWQHQQKKIDTLGAENPQVMCPTYRGEKHGFTDDGWTACNCCNETGKVPLTKAQEYRIKELEAEIERLKELLQLHRENDRIAGAME